MTTVDTRFDPSKIYECERPPLIEMYIGVGFLPMSEIEVPHFGLFWSLIQDRFPRLQMRPPLTPPIAPEVEFRSEAGEVITARQEALSRCWFVAEGDDELIQVQTDRFYRNWRKRPGATDGYPRFSELKQRFIDSWAEYLAFLAGSSCPVPEVVECEIGYVNRFETRDRPVSWAIPVLSGFHGFLPDVHLSHLQLNARLALPAALGTAHLTLHPESPATTKVAAWRHTTVAKGRPSATSPEGISAWLDSARATLNYIFVTSFCDDLHREWGTRARK